MIDEKDGRNDGRERIFHMLLEVTVPITLEQLGFEGTVFDISIYLCITYVFIYRYIKFLLHLFVFRQLQSYFRQIYATYSTSVDILIDKVQR